MPAFTISADKREMRRIVRVHHGHINKAWKISRQVSVYSLVLLRSPVQEPLMMAQFKKLSGVDSPNPCPRDCAFR